MLQLFCLQSNSHDNLTINKAIKSVYTSLVSLSFFMLSKMVRCSINYEARTKGNHSILPESYMVGLIFFSPRMHVRKLEEQGRFMYSHSVSARRKRISLVYATHFCDFGFLPWCFLRYLAYKINKNLMFRISLDPFTPIINSLLWVIDISLLWQLPVLLALLHQESLRRVLLMSSIYYHNKKRLNYVKKL